MIGLKQAERCEIDLKKGGLGMMLVMERSGGGM